MAVTWTTEQVTGMAPDAASVKAGRKLAIPSKWQTLGKSGDLLWGEIKGSGSKPYQTCIDLSAPAFKCSCPSRKFPCKHGVALAYVFAEHPETFTEGEPLDWASEWLEGRARRAEHKARKEAEAEQPLTPEEQEKREVAQARRREKRADKMQAGLTELQRWLADLVHQGLASGIENRQAWQHMAARLVDAQVTGAIQRWVRAAPEVRYLTGQWQNPVLQILGRIQLALSAIRMAESLPEPQREDVQDLLGVPRSREELLQGEGVSDHWLVIGTRNREEDQLLVRETWLWGETSQRWALLLDFMAVAAHGGLPLHPTVGTAFDGECVFYPGSWPVRALIRTSGPLVASDAQAWRACCGSIAELHARYGELLPTFPWLDHMPGGIRQVSLVRQGEDWWLLDAERQQVPLARHATLPWKMLALSAGQPFDLLGEWDGVCFYPLTLLVGECCHDLGVQEMTPVFSSPGSVLPQVWEPLVRSSLLGINRGLPSLPQEGALGASLEQIRQSEENPDIVFLKTVALVSLYARAGSLPVSSTLEVPAPAPQEVRRQVPEIPELSFLLQGRQASELFQRMSDRDLVLPSAQLPELLDRGAQDSSLRAPLLRVLGSTGVWLAGLNERWRWAVDLAAGHEELGEDDWESGSFAQRRVWLERLRRQDPQQARERLESVWKSEAARERRALLEVFLQNPDAGDPEFLERIVQSDRSKEVRALAIRLLLRIPQSTLAIRLRETVCPRLHPVEARSLLGKKVQLQVDLPEQWDPAWTDFGVQEKPPAKMGEKSWWLSKLIERVDPQVWCDQWGRTPDEIMMLLKGHEWGSMLAAGWSIATVEFAHQEWARALLRTDTGREWGNQLWSLLSSEQGEEILLIRLKAAHKGEKLRKEFASLLQLDHFWSASFSAHILELWLAFLADSAKNGETYRTYAYQSILSHLAEHLDPSSVLAREAEFAPFVQNDSPWEKPISEMLATVRIRHDMIQAIESLP